MALGSTQPLTEMSTRNFPGGKRRPARKADNLIAICEPTVWQIWTLDVSEPYGPARPVRATALPFYLHVTKLYFVANVLYQLYGMDDRGVGVRVPVGSTIFLFSTSSSSGLWSPPSLLSDGYLRLFPRDKSVGA
jgi:hypothetical protein